MKRVNELYNFDKFWAAYQRQDRCVSRWDEKRTDMAVFINRTLATWFTGKCFQVEVEKYESYTSFDYILKKPEPTKYKVFTKYIYITNITFAFTKVPTDKITIYYIHPHSEEIEKVVYGISDFMRIRLLENEGDFRILKKFYPTRQEEIELPTLNQTKQI